MNILYIPAKEGSNGYPKIKISSINMEKDYDIMGQCGNFRTHEIHKNERKGIINVLKRITNNLKAS